MIFHFQEAWGSLVMFTRRTGRKNRMRVAVLSTKRRLPGWSWGSPRWCDSWCSVLENQRVETFPCHILYCLLHLGQGFSFCPMLVEIPLLRLGERQLSFNWRIQVQARCWQTSTLLQSPWGWHLILCCWLCTLTSLWRGARKKRKKLDLSISWDSHLVTERLDNIHSDRKLQYSTLCFYFRLAVLHYISK